MQVIEKQTQSKQISEVVKYPIGSGPADTVTLNFKKFVGYGDPQYSMHYEDNKYVGSCEIYYEQLESLEVAIAEFKKWKAEN